MRQVVHFCATPRPGSDAGWPRSSPSPPPACRPPAPKAAPPRLKPGFSLLHSGSGLNGARQASCDRFRLNRRASSPPSRRHRRMGIGRSAAGETPFVAGEGRKSPRAQIDPLVEVVGPPLVFWRTMAAIDPTHGGWWLRPVRRSRCRRAGRPGISVPIPCVVPRQVAKDHENGVVQR